MDSTLRTRARTHLDERLSVLRPAELAPPPKGWIKAIREALGMTGQQFADRMGIKPPSVIDPGLYPQRDQRPRSVGRP
jgi:DNA-binding transcriptional regulator YiaG